MLVDPRPYTYEYRKGRYGNPTLYIYFDLANQGTSTKVCIIDIPINPMITFHLMKEKCTPPLRNCKSQNPLPDNIGNLNAISLKLRIISHKKEPTTKEMNKLLATLKSKIKGINFPPSIKITKEPELTII